MVVDLGGVDDVSGAAFEAKYGSLVAFPVTAQQSFDLIDLEPSPCELRRLARYQAAAPSRLNACTSDGVSPTVVSSRQSPAVGWAKVRTRTRGTIVTSFAVGDHVRWNSEAGPVTGVITKKHTSDVEYKGHARHCSEQDPQYEIKSDKTEHVAMHKTNALTKIS